MNEEDTISEIGSPQCKYQSTSIRQQLVVKLDKLHEYERRLLQSYLIKQRKNINQLHEITSDLQKMIDDGDFVGLENERLIIDILEVEMINQKEEFQSINDNIRSAKYFTNSLLVSLDKKLENQKT
ncbi:hypothetical protein SS50377_27408 [Spironucleus salmonicida]|uniref:Uncharacterized protein n=1 Tax=Spironucleus salmonicida TaxID=348837 RepID=A0A9P8LN59_9EUKA|nr:hypothetical protein SS50377_27408 [Spironucleus salmonicida]